MRDDNCNRKSAFVEELLNDWDKLNIAAKSLIAIGVIMFIAAIGITFSNDASQGMLKSIEVVFRTSLASIFGFLLSSNLKGSKNNLNIKNANSMDRSKCKDEIAEYNYRDGNIIQIMVALTVCLVSIFVILGVFILGLTENVAAISQIRDLMCSSIGFLIGESKIKT